MNYTQQENTSDIRIQAKSKKTMPTFRQRFSGALSDQGQKRKETTCLYRKRSLSCHHSHWERLVEF